MCPSTKYGGCVKGSVLTVLYSSVCNEAIACGARSFRTLRLTWPRRPPGISSGFPVLWNCQCQTRARREVRSFAPLAARPCEKNQPITCIIRLQIARLSDTFSQRPDYFRRGPVEPPRSLAIRFVRFRRSHMKNECESISVPHKWYPLFPMASPLADC